MRLSVPTRRNAKPTSSVRALLCPPYIHLFSTDPACSCCTAYALPKWQHAPTKYVSQLLRNDVRAGNRRVLESLGLLDSASIPYKAPASKPRVPREPKVWPQSDRAMRDARCLKPPQRLSLGEPGRAFSTGGSYVHAGIDTSRLPIPSDAKASLMKSKHEILHDRRDKAITVLEGEMDKQPIEPLGLLMAVREVETIMGTQAEAALSARETLRSIMGSQAEHAELVGRLDEHMVANDIRGTPVYRLMEVSATTFYIWRGRTAQSITERLSATVDEAVAAYLAGVALGIDTICNVPEESRCEVPEGAPEAADASGATVASYHASSVRPGYSSTENGKKVMIPARSSTLSDDDWQTGTRGKWQRVHATQKAETWQHDDYPELVITIPHTCSDANRRVRLHRVLERHTNSIHDAEGRRKCHDVEGRMRKRVCTDVTPSAPLAKRPREKLHQVSIMADGRLIDVIPGMAVEVRQVEKGLVGSKYEATVIELRGFPGSDKYSEALVEYRTLYDNDAGVPSSPVSSELGPEAIVWNVAGQCGTPGCLLPDFHHGPCTPSCANDGLRERKAKGGGPSPVKLREWVKSSSLTTIPDKPLPEWHKSLAVGDEVEMLHDGGFWQVAVRECMPRCSKSKKGTRFTVRAIGYAIEHTVSANVLRPRTVL